MKQILVPFLIVVAFILSCSSPQNTPAEVLEEALINISQSNYDAVLENAMSGEGELTDEEQKKLKGIFALGQAPLSDHEGIKGIQIISEQYSDDENEVIIHYQIVFNDGHLDETDIATLRLANKRWKLVFKAYSSDSSQEDVADF